MPSHTDFDVDRTIAQAWAEFEVRLADVISVIDDSADFTIGVETAGTEADAYVRFCAISRTQIRAEVALAPLRGSADLLDDHQLADLRAAGWTLPAPGADHMTMERDQEDSPALARAAVIALRDAYGVAHPVFLAPDQLAEVLTPRGPSLPPGEAADPAEVTAIIPTDRAHLDSLVEEELTALYGYAPYRDADGDIALRVGSTVVFLRTSHDHRELLLFSVIVHDVVGRSRAAEVINDLNTEARMVSFHLRRDKVFLTLSVFAHPFVPAHLRQAIRLVSELADGIDGELARKLHGRTTYE